MNCCRWLLLTCLFGSASDLLAEGNGYPHGRGAEQKTLFYWPGQFARLAAAEEDEGGEEEEGPLETDRPDFTEASSVVGRGHVQLELGYTFLQDKEHGERVRSHSFPETLLRVGMIAPWFEFRLAWNYGIQSTTAGGVTTTISEPEDLYVGAKLALTLQDGIFPEMALVPQMNLPTAPQFIEDLTPVFEPNRAFGAGEILPGVNWLYGWDVGEIGYIAGSTQVNRTLDESGGYYEEFAQSITTGYKWTKKLTQYTEWFAFFPHGADTALPEHYLNGGYTYLVTNDLQLDVRAGVGLNSPATDFFGGLGAAYRY